MQRPCLMQRKGAVCSTAASQGKRLPDARALRQNVLMAATRGDWRTALEDTTGADGGAANSNFKSNGAGGVERSSGKAATTATLPPPTPTQPKPAASTPAADAASPSPWSQPPAAAAAKAAAAAPAAAAAKAVAAAPAAAAAKAVATPPAKAAAAAPKQQQQPSAAAAAAGTRLRADLISLPTFDLVAMLSEPKTQANAFTALAATSAVLAVLSILEPQAVLDVALPNASTSSPLDVTFMRIVGVTLAASAAVEYSLKHAAESQLLKSATYQRLMAGCAVKSAGFLAVLLLNTPATFRLWSPLAWLAYAGTAVAAGGINLAVISHTSGKGLVPPPLDSGAPQNATSWGYTACIGLYLLTAAACFAPEILFTGDPYSDVTPLVKGVWAPGFLLAAVMSYVLKDAADRSRLGASTFKNLNLGLAALEYGYSIIFGSSILSDQVDIDLPALANLGGALLIATFALYTYATAKK